MEVELRPEIQSGLSLLESFSDDSFEKLCKTACQSAVNSESEIHLDEQLLSGNDPAAFKEAHASLVCVLLEAAKHDLDAAGVNAVLTDHGVNSTKSAMLSGMYKSCYSKLREILSKTKFGPPKLVDVNWRLDWNMRGSRLERVNEASYVIKFIMDDGKEVQFCCSADELQDFGSKMKDAAKQLERMVS